MTSPLPPWPPPATDFSVALQTMLSQQATIQQDVSALRANVGQALTHIEVIGQRNKTADELHRDYEARLRLLERFRWTIGGVALVAGFLSGFLGYLLGHTIH